MSDDDLIVEVFESPIYLDYHYIAGRSSAEFLKATHEGRLLGRRSRGTGKVLVPPQGVCPETGDFLGEVVELGHSGTVIGFTVVHLPIPGSELKPPFAVANILVDGADEAFSHLVGECEAADVRLGMRVEAVWKPHEQWGYGLENIRWFRPIDEPDVDLEALKVEHLVAAEGRRHA